MLRSDLGHAIAWSPAPRLVAQTENLPYADQTIDLDPSVRDTFGVPAPRLTYDWRRLQALAYRRLQALAYMSADAIVNRYRQQARTARLIIMNT